MLTISVSLLIIAHQHIVSDVEDTMKPLSAGNEGQVPICLTCSTARLALLTWPTSYLWLRVLDYQPTAST